MIIIITALFSISPATAQTQNFEAGKNTYLLNGKPFVVRAGELHYTRIPRQYWEHRIQMLKAMGMNTVCIYLFWNIHEQEQGVFDFSGQNDVAEFIRLIQKNGMYCIVRPGPYVCAEWDMGGLPWWLLKKKELQVRRKSDPFFMERTRIYLNETAKILAPYQIQNGGPVIMVQVENEIGQLPEARDYSSAANKAFQSNVPKPLLDYLSKNKKILLPHVKKLWEENGTKNSGSWETVFGKSLATDELFMAWHFAVFANQIAKAGKEIYNLPAESSRTRPRKISKRRSASSFTQYMAGRIARYRYAFARYISWRFPSLGSTIRQTE